MSPALAPQVRLLAPEFRTCNERFCFFFIDKAELPVLFTLDSPRTGFRHYAYLFKPRHAKKGYKYPTILYIYAGPEVQLVKNVWMG